MMVFVVLAGLMVLVTAAAVVVTAARDGFFRVSPIDY